LRRKTRHDLSQASISAAHEYDKEDMTFASALMQSAEYRHSALISKPTLTPYLLYKQNLANHFRLGNDIWSTSNRHNLNLTCEPG